MKKGELLEAKISEEYHLKFTPLLVSPKLLRDYGLGQIDVAFIYKTNLSKEWEAKIIECKISQYPSKIQIKRLLNSCDYLSKVLNMYVFLEVKFCKNVKDSLNF